MNTALAGVSIPDTVQWIFWVISLELLVVIGLLYIAKVTMTSRRVVLKKIILYCIFFSAEAFLSVV